MASAIVGVLSILVPIGIFAITMLKDAMWPSGWDIFDDIKVGLGVSGLIMVILFSIHAAKSEAVPQGKRSLWVVVLITANLFALPFYWWWYIRKPAVRQAHES